MDSSIGGARKALPREVIDLCSSDDDGVETSVIRIPHAQGTPSLASRKEKRSLNSASGDNHPSKALRRGVASGDRAAEGSGIRQDSFAPIIFLNGDISSDDAVLTDGLSILLRDVNNQCVRTCAGDRRSTAKASKHEELNVGARDLSTLRHIQQGDNWSCGFRNLQMMLTALLPLLPGCHSFFRRLHDSSIGGDAFAIPSVFQLQQLLERCWRDGFDVRGARHYGNQVVGRASKIGAVEVANAMAYAGVDATIVQFVKCRESRELLPGFCDAYFSKKLGRERCCSCGGDVLGTSNGNRSRVMAQELLQMAISNAHKPQSCPCPVLPLYLQWEGHSVTVVGVERNDFGLVKNLLVFDPMKVGSRVKDALKRKQVGQLRLPCTRLASKDSQIVVCSTASLSDEERENMKPEMGAVTAAEDVVLRHL